MCPLPSTTNPLGRLGLCLRWLQIRLSAQSTEREIQSYESYIRSETSRRNLQLHLIVCFCVLS